MQLIRPKTQQKIRAFGAKQVSLENANSKARSQFIKDVYLLGGKPFVERAKQFGTTEDGEPLDFKRWTEEFYELIGDFRVPETLTSGASQVGKTLGHTLLLCDCLTEGKLDTLWAYDQDASLKIQVPTNFTPVIKFWLKAKGIVLKRSEGKQDIKLFQVKGADAQFTYVSTSKTKAGKGTAAAGGIAVGVSRDILFKEERSQYPPGAGDPLDRRLDAGKLPVPTIRELGTPGAGQGIEAEIDKADHHFYPHTDCVGCDRSIPLNPKGCLLKRVTQTTRTGKTTSGYLSKSGKPIAWYHGAPGNADNKEKANAAEFRCLHCETPISDKQRQQAYFRCLLKKITLREFLDNLPKGVPTYRYKVGISLSPLLRITTYNLAASIISSGLNSQNLADWQQQVLGLPSEPSGGSLFDVDAIARQAVSQWRPPQPGRKYLAGLDPNFGGGNFFTLQIWDIAEKPYALVKQYRSNSGATVAYHEAFAKLILNQYRPVITAVETNTGGKIVLENLIRDCPDLRFDPVLTSGASKPVNTDRIAIALESLEVIYPPDWEGCAEHPSETGELVAGELYNFSALTREATVGNDDCVMSWAIAFARLEEALKLSANS